MLRHEFSADLSRKLGLVSDDSHNVLYADYLSALRAESPNAPYLTWEAWGFSVGLFDPSSLALLTRNFNETQFRCAACGHTCTGARLAEQPQITCPACGRADQMQLLAAPSAPPPAGSIASTLPGTRGGLGSGVGTPNFSLPPDLLSPDDEARALPVAPAPPPLPKPESHARTAAGAEIDRQIEEFDSAGLGETIYADDAPGRVLPELPSLIRTMQAQNGGPGVPQVSPTQIGQTGQSGAGASVTLDADALGSALNVPAPGRPDPVPPTEPGNDKPDTLIDIHADDIHERLAGDRIDPTAGLPVRNDEDFRVRQERLTRWFQEFRYEQVIAEAKALLEFDGRAMGVRHLLERAEQAQETIIELEQLGYEARERGDFETAESSVLKLQEFVPLGYASNVLTEIRDEKKRMNALLSAVEALTAANQFDEALERLTALVAEHPNFTPALKLRETFEVTRPLKEELNAAMSARDIEAVKQAVARLQEVAPHDLGARGALAWIEQATTIDRHDRLVDEAEAALKAGRSARAIELAGQAKRIVPGSGRAREVLAKVEARGKRLRMVYMAIGGVALVVVLIVAALAMLATMRDSRRTEAMQAEAGEDRVDALTSFLAAYPGDDQATTALAEAEAEWRRMWLAKARALQTDPSAQVASLTEYLGRWSDDTAAQALLADAARRVQEAERRAQDRLALRAILDRHRNNPETRLEKLREYAEAHPENSEVMPEIERTRMEVAQAAFESAVDATRDLIARWELVVQWQTKLAVEKGEAWKPLRTRVDEWLEHTRNALEAQAHKRSQTLDSRDGAREFLSHVATLVALDADFGAALEKEAAFARQIIAEDDRADDLAGHAEEMQHWFEADGLLQELRRFVTDVPRLRPQLQPRIERLTMLAGQRPPDVAGLTFLRQQAFTGLNGRVTLNVYRHDLMAAALRMPDVPDALADRLDEGGEFTRLDIEFTMLPPVGVTQAQFRMGSPADEPGHTANEQLHEVTLTRPWLIARTELSQEVWEAVRRWLAERGDALLTPNPSGFQSPANPVERINWKQADEFCRAAGLRLPTEAEWAYACRAGTSTPFAFGDAIRADQANFNGRKPWPDMRMDVDRRRTVPVGSLPPNGFGLYEMHGNVREWCADWFGRFDTSPVTDPTGPTGEQVARVLRGGSWASAATHIRSAARSGTGPDSSSNTVGFRPAASAR